MMKKISTLIISLILMIGVLGGCATKQEVVVLPVPEIVGAMVEKEYIPMPMEIDEQMAKEMFRINLDNVEEYAIAQTGRSPGVGLIVVVRAKEGKVDQVKADMELLLQDKVGSAFYPDEQEAAQNAQIRVDGPYVSLFILNEEIQQEAMQMYDAALRGEL